MDALTHEPELCTRLVFLEDYDLSSAGELVQGVDVWINMPSRPWEACGTSGMKVLVNGGFNLSVLDRWSEEAYDPNAGWVIGDGDALDEAARDGRDAATLYDILENKVVPAFFARDVAGSPRDWLARIRCSLSRLTPPYSSNRLPHEYIEPLYLAAADEFHRRSTDKAAVAVAMHN